MKFDLERAFESAMWAVVLVAVMMVGAVLVWTIASMPVLGLALAALAVVFIIGGFWPRRK